VNVSVPVKQDLGVYLILLLTTTADPPLVVGDFTLQMVAPEASLSFARTSIVTDVLLRVVAKSPTGTGQTGQLTDTVTVAVSEVSHPGLHRAYVNVSVPQKHDLGVYLILLLQTTAVPPFVVGDFTLQIVAPVVSLSFARTSIVTAVPLLVAAESATGTGQAGQVTETVTVAVPDVSQLGLHRAYVNVSVPQKHDLGVYLILPLLTTAVPPLLVGDCTLQIVAPVVSLSFAKISIVTDVLLLVVAESSAGTGQAGQFTLTVTVAVEGWQLAP